MWTLLTLSDKKDFIQFSTEPCIPYDYNFCKSLPSDLMVKIDEYILLYDVGGGGGGGGGGHFFRG